MQLCPIEIFWHPPPKKYRKHSTYPKIWELELLLDTRKQDMSTNIRLNLLKMTFKYYVIFLGGEGGGVIKRSFCIAGGGGGVQDRSKKDHMIFERSLTS